MELRNQVFHNGFHWEHFINERRHLPNFKFSINQVTFKNPFFSPAPSQEVHQFFNNCSPTFSFFNKFIKMVFHKSDWSKFFKCQYCASFTSTGNEIFKFRMS